MDMSTLALKLQGTACKSLTSVKYVNPGNELI